VGFRPSGSHGIILVERAREVGGSENILNVTGIHIVS
jgi:hypothetical protein